MEEVLAQPTEPLPEHKAMAREVGQWDAEIKFWTSPDAEPEVHQGSETVTMMGPLWSLGEFRMSMGDMPFVGRSQMGFDPVKKKFVGTWIDTISPHMQIMEGSYDVKSHTLTMMTTGYHWMLGKVVTTKNVTRYVDANTKVFEMHMPVEGAAGEWTKSMEIHYRRKAPN
jgi:hypothetical protein